MNHVTWFDLFPAFADLQHKLQPSLGREWAWEAFAATHFEITHVLFAVIIALGIVLGAVRYAAALRAAPDGGLVPPRKFGLRNLYEGLADTVYGLVEGVMGEKDARKHLPLLGTIFFFILFSNLASLIPGFRAPTDSLKTNLAMALTVFVLTHAYGIRSRGWGYIKDFTGHLGLKPLYLVPIIPLLLGIELISHLVRPMSLSIRLAVNMVADHAVGAAFFALVPLVVPVPFLALGVFVSVVQATVFTLLSASYFSMAVAHGDDDH